MMVSLEWIGLLASPARAAEPLVRDAIAHNLGSRHDSAVIETARKMKPASSWRHTGFMSARVRNGA
ncbi:TPA: hypothetical protein SAY52_000072 [Burkholderia cenocepacia]|uniref:hypothetical protein n=1 Tax=unclassified Burkholderia TaxID=2613784 RepID=UPI00158D427D|nr:MULTISPECIES: hypothetical protein [unclassified Burkholderia]HEF5869525.1 hypothetical protein [Burkholderia cenocepacia]